MIPTRTRRYRPVARAWRLDPADWRIAPVAGLGLPIAILRGLIDEGIDTAGELWPVFESGELTGSLGFSAEQGRKIGQALDALRAGAGDPSPRRWP
jgi:hypothetical protein